MLAVSLEGRSVQERTVEPGAVVYREGDDADALYIIREGEVEVLRAHGDDNVRLAVLRKGAMFGEVGIIRNKARSTTTRALSEVTLVALPRADFLAAFRDDNPLALQILRALCERLVEADSELVAHRVFTDPARCDAIKQVRLHAASADVERQIGTEGIGVERLPFRVGRQAISGDGIGSDEGELLLYVPKSGRVSPIHFAIEQDGDHLTLRDLGSHLGTQVNGTRIAHFEPSETAPLHFGDNTVHAGGMESPYRFHIVVERAEA